MNEAVETSYNDLATALETVDTGQASISSAVAARDEANKAAEAAQANLDSVSSDLVGDLEKAKSSALELVTAAQAVADDVTATIDALAAPTPTEGDDA